MRSDRPALPQFIWERLDAVRRIGNYSAHPIKSTQTGAVVDVDPAEAEYNLDVLDLLFGFYYVQPAKAQALQHRVHAKG